jgi:hypothetical protein
LNLVQVKEMGADAGPSAHSMVGLLQYLPTVVVQDALELARDSPANPVHALLQDQSFMCVLSICMILSICVKECCIFKCCRLPVVLAVLSHQPDMWLMPCISDLEQWYSAAKAQGHFAPLRPLTVSDSLLRLTGMVVQLAQSQCTGQPAAFLGAFGCSMLDPASHRVMQTPQQFNDERRQQQAALMTLEAGAAEAAAAAERLGLPADEAEPEWTPGAAASVQIMLLLDFSQCPKVTRSVRLLIALCCRRR